MRWHPVPMSLPLRRGGAVSKMSCRPLIVRSQLMRWQPVPMSLPLRRGGAVSKCLVDL